MKQFILFLVIFAIFCSFSFCVFATDVEGAVTEPDTSAPAEVTIKDINDNLSVIQSQLWLVLIAGLFWLVYKLFRIFF